MVVAVVSLILVGATVYWRLHSDTTLDPGPAPDAPRLLSPPEDPRVTTTSPFLNVRPTVQYMGDAACADCHADVVASYQQHPMGRSLAPIAAATAVERYEAEVHNPFEAGGLRYRAEKRGERVFHWETAVVGGAEAEVEIAFAVGSGRRGRSYLVEHDGYLFQSPITWYPLDKTWALSPTYDTVNSHFGRPITVGCLFCHSNQVDPDDHAANRFRAPLFRGHAIGCERCHGPGEAHVKAREAGEGPSRDVDYTIVNPRRLEPALRDAVCQQCHLQGEARVLPRGRAYFEYRPGLPLHSFVADFVRPAEQRPDNKFVGTVEQMIASRCFQRSTGQVKLGCISCHDPHELPGPERRVGFYRDRCLKCHASQGCSLPLAERLQKSAEDSCIACHMESRPASVRHTAMTDHTIPRRSAAAAAKAADWPRPGQLPLVPFPRALRADQNPEHSRNLGLALVEAARAQSTPAAGRQFLDWALPLLKTAVAADPRDVPAWEAYASALLLLGQPEAAQAACAAVLSEKPERETTLFLAAAVAMQLRRPADVRTFTERAIKINPWMWQYRSMLGEALAQKGDWEGAAAASREALRLEPVNLPSRQLLLRCYLQLGDKTGAREELEACVGLLRPTNRQEFRRWVEHQLNSK
jgi:hypothetical protein